MMRSKLVMGVVVAGLALAPATYALAETGAEEGSAGEQVETVEGAASAPEVQAEASSEPTAEEADDQVAAPSVAGAAASEQEAEATESAEASPEPAPAEVTTITVDSTEEQERPAVPTTAPEAEPAETQAASDAAAEPYRDSDGAVANGERYVDLGDGSGWGWYFFDSGSVAHGWRYIESGSKWVYYDPYSGRMWHGEGYVSKDDADTDDPLPGWCYFDDVSGATTYGWKYIDAGSKWVYYDPYTGRMWHGEGYVAKDDASTDDPMPGWCHFDESTGATTYGWKYLAGGNKWVYYDAYTGRMHHGEWYVSKDDAKTDDPIPGWCYFDEATGATQYGWKHLPDGRYVYYDTTTGRMYHGRHTINDRVYIFNSTNGAADKYGYQNRAGYYRVSSNNVWLGHASDPFSYVTPSRIGVDATRQDCVNAFLQRAREYLGTPYVWDYARQPGVGVDCVGLVIQCAYATGMDLGDINTYNHYYTGPNGWHSHDANNLWNSSQAMHVSLSDRQPGDVISWPGHVAVYLGNDQVIEAYSPATGVRQIGMWYNGTPRGVIRLFQ